MKIVIEFVKDLLTLCLIFILTPVLALAQFWIPGLIWYVGVNWCEWSEGWTMALVIPLFIICSLGTQMIAASRPTNGRFMDLP